MRSTSGFNGPGEQSNVFPIPLKAPPRYDHEGLSAFRGFLFAASASALLWGLGLTALWLLVWRK